MAKREKIAAKIMAGLAASDEAYSTASEAAEVAVRWADALLAELAKQPTRPASPRCPYCTMPLEIHSHGGTLYGVCIEGGCAESAGAEFAVVMKDDQYIVAP